MVVVFKKAMGEHQSAHPVKNFPKEKDKTQYFFLTPAVKFPDRMILSDARSVKMPFCDQ
jgi:hypothetical protein